MPTDRERAQQTAQWIRDGRPSPWSNFSCGGCLWVLVFLFLLGMTLIACAGAGLR
jgi:hypothetical protein